MTFLAKNFVIQVFLNYVDYQKIRLERPNSTQQTVCKHIKQTCDLGA